MGTQLAEQRKDLGRRLMAGAGCKGVKRQSREFVEGPRTKMVGMRMVQGLGWGLEPR